MSSFFSSFATPILLVAALGCAELPSPSVSADAAPDTFDDASVVDAGDRDATAPPPDASPQPSVETGGLVSLGAHRVAMILFNFENDTSQVGTVAAARRAMFTGATSVNALYREASFGRFWLEGADREDGDIYGWYTIPFDDFPCDREDWAAAARGAAEADGFDADRYDYVAYIHPWGPCGGQGRPEWDPPSTFFRRFNIRSAGHEFGHAIGFAHSASLACTSDGRTPVTLSDQCEVDEYGDTSDIMGGAFVGHVNQVHKGRMGWLEPSNTRTIDEGGSYELAPIEAPTDEVQVLRIPRVVGDDGVIQYLYVELRQSFGFDEVPPGSPLADGVSLRLAPPYDGSLMRTLLLDTTPETPELEDAALRVGRRFVDDATGITIETISVDEGRATIAVDVGEPSFCERAAPTLTLVADSESVRAGEPVSYELAVRNEDAAGCFLSTFIVSVTDLPEGWAQDGISGLEAVLMPGASGARTRRVAAPVGTAPGSYDISFEAVLAEDPTLTAAATLTLEVVE